MPQRAARRVSPTRHPPPPPFLATDDDHGPAEPTSSRVPIAACENTVDVSSSASDVRSRSAQIRAARLTRTGRVLGAEGLSRERKRDEGHAQAASRARAREPEEACIGPSRATIADVAWRDPLVLSKADSSWAGGSAFEASSSFSLETFKSRSATADYIPNIPPENIVSSPTRDGDSVPPQVQAQHAPIRVHLEPAYVYGAPSERTLRQSSTGSSAAEMEELEVSSVGDISACTGISDPAEAMMIDRPMSRNLQSPKVPSARSGRLFHYGGAHACASLQRP
ncbi:hypothetical protein BD310DRAFT_382491 [Dichomitus squalens]|uniref:Uncharacterized protein n=1 Tax=Dichomitus squalens TaxID=114155 RepID=A0A4Q9PE03_9APHY|nr:hypothetical protein BD310DRAFT_382491 [Dichomitus squalens]